MLPSMYGDYVDWYRLIDPPDDHREEAAAFQAAFERAVDPAPRTLLELGSGAGHNAVHLKQRFRCTLADLSPGMLELSRALNPECEHVEADMRALRLERTFDAVLVHDAVMYMTREAELVAAARTAFVHTRPGGAAVFAPDCTRETFRDTTEVIEADDGGRSVRGLEWSWDPDPDDDTMTTEYVLLLREGGEVRSVHDRHVEGLFSRDTWRRVLEGVGYRVETFERPIGDGEVDEIFLAVRPA